MITQMTLRESILSNLQAAPECELDKLVIACSGFTWAQIFLELDQMSRSGEVHIRQHVRFGYSLAVLINEGQKTDEPKPGLVGMMTAR